MERLHHIHDIKVNVACPDINVICTSSTSNIGVSVLQNLDGKFSRPFLGKTRHEQHGNAIKSDPRRD